MSARRYKLLLPLRVHTADGSYTQGETFTKEFSPGDELENVRSGLLEIVPVTYRVLTDTEVMGHRRGETFSGAFLIENESALIAGGHIERVATDAKTKKEKH